MAAAAAAEARARGVLARLQAALELPPEDGDVPARVLAEHLVGARRRQKLLLAQLRALRLLLGVLQAPGPPPAPRPCVSDPPPPSSGGGGGGAGALAGAEGGLRGATGALGGRAPALAQLGRGRRLLQRLRRALGRPQLETARRRSQEKVTSLRGRVASRRRALRSQEEAARRAPPPAAPPLGPGLLELQERLWERLPLWAEVWGLQRRFALDWEPERGRVRLLGAPGAVWTLLLDAGYPRGGACGSWPPPARSPRPPIGRPIAVAVGGAAGGDPP
ncbi:uncharacterized protein [Anser cygnoides]|uniref:uncharacterized protein n=1 Tax=Anser cygnoides TaxID=8845 RepID=UPI0034D198B7